MPNTPYPYFDCDNHFYEPPEALTKYMPEEFKDVIQYVEINGRTKLLVEGKVSEFIPNPTFEVVAAPGSTVEYLAGNNPEGKTQRELMTIIKGIPEFQYKTKERYELLENQKLVGALMFPTLASVIEGHLPHRPDFCHAAFHALNRWMKEEWGFGEDGKFWGTPALTLMEPDKALDEINWIIDNGAKVVLIRPSFVPGWRGPRGMGSLEFEPVFRRIEEAGLLVAFHTSDNGNLDIYKRYATADRGEFRPFDAYADPLFSVMDVNQRTCGDHLASIVCQGLFDRHPTLKVCYVETGTSWLYPLWDRLGHVYKMMPKAFKRHPHDVIREHVWFHPHFEENPDRLIEIMGADHVLFGSDWPHAEGLAEPADWIQAIEKYSDEDKAKIMGGNMMKLLGIAA